MRVFKLRSILAGLMLSGLNFGHAQTTPYNSLRVLIVYTDAAAYVWGSNGENFYKDYFVGVIDGVNQTLEASETDVRLQIAGVIHDKIYSEYYSHLPANVRGCFNRDDVINGTNGMGRYGALVEKYAADYIILVHQNEPGGCAGLWGSSKVAGYGAMWVQFPAHVELWAHELGHGFNMANHCYGNRMTLKSNNDFAAGPVPDEIGNITAGNDHHPLGDTLEAEYGPADRGFHTTMAYGEHSACNYGLNYTVGGVPRIFYFWTQGVYGPTEWTGTFSNPSIGWYDQVTDNTHSTGGSIGYIRRLKFYAEGAESYRDTIYPTFNEAMMIQAYGDSIIHLQEVPSEIIISSDMSIGESVADTEWVYAHFAASNSVEIRPGFSITGSASMKISVGISGGMFAKHKADNSNKKKTPGQHSNDKNVDFRIRYIPTAKDVLISLKLNHLPSISISIYDAHGAQVKRLLVSASHSSSFLSKTISVSDLSDGIYFLRVIAGEQEFQRQFMKW